AGAIAPLAIVDAVAGPGTSLEARQAAYALMSIVLAVASVVPIYITFAATRERPEYQALPTPALRESFRIAASNKAFLIAVGVYLLTWIPIDLIQYVLIFLIRDYFGLSGDERDVILTLIFGVAVLALPLWVWLSGRWDKNRAYQVGIAFLAAVLIALSFVSPGMVGAIYLLAVLAGIGLSAAHAIPLAILPDTIEWDELRTASRQEGAYYSVVTLIQKLVGAATIALTGTLLAASGYIQGARPDAIIAQPESALNAIRALTGPLPAAFFIAGILLVSFYPISRERHARIIKALDKRRELRKRSMSG
ncbi:MAG TPA: MFS transporter, partial [Anaerolineae bacterium]|nr:MFS transporter [Anaerolineae bacterium]